jgi:hypothetical protein
MNTADRAAMAHDLRQQLKDRVDDANTLNFIVDLMVVTTEHADEQWATVLSEFRNRFMQMALTDPASRRGLFLAADAIKRFLDTEETSSE